MSEPFGSWLLENLVAVGGCGEIWRATRDETGTPYAIKRLHTHLVRNEEARTQFAVEQKLVTTLPEHVNVVHGDEAGEVEGRPYVALELAPGEDLRRVLIPTEATAQVLLPRARTLAIVRAACAGVAHLHAHGWVHGDVCPANLVVHHTAPPSGGAAGRGQAPAVDPRRAGDHVVLIDLGVARRIGEAGSVRGTAAYMAPEQVRGGAWTAATDVFALGIVLWELVAGARLFHRGPVWLSQAAAVEQPAPPLSDPAVDAIAQAALAKDPAQRLPDAAALLRELARLG